MVLDTSSDIMSQTNITGPHPVEARCPWRHRDLQPGDIDLLQPIRLIDWG